jgi:hypothetical protein
MNNLLMGSSNDLELFVTTTSNTPADVTVTAPLFSPGSTLASTTVSRGDIEKITLSNGLRGVDVELGNKGVLISATQEITVFGDICQGKLEMYRHWCKCFRHMIHLVLMPQRWVV